MGKILSVFNQKGGVGKTTTVVNLAAGLGKQGKKVLVVDMDPQGNATSGLGVNKNGVELTIYDVLIADRPLGEAVVDSTSENVQVIPANNVLAGFEIEIIDREEREHVLSNHLGDVRENYDFIIVDCPPSLGLLSLNALVASDSVIIPIQCEYYALEGVSQLMETVNLIKKGLNPELQIEGVVLSMFDGRNNLSIEVVEEVKKFFKDKVFKTMIPRNIRLAEAPSFGMSAIDYDKNSKGAIAYKYLARELIKQNQ